MIPNTKSARFCFVQIKAAMKIQQNEETENDRQGVKNEIE